MAFVVCLCIAPAGAQDAQQPTPAPHPIYLPPPPDEAPPPAKPAVTKAASAKAAAKTTPAVKPVAKMKPAPTKLPPVKMPAVAKTPAETAPTETAPAKAATPAVMPTKAAGTVKTGTPAVAPVKTPTTKPTVSAGTAPAAKTVVVPTPVAPPAVAIAPKAEPVPEEVPVVAAGPPPDPSVTFGFYSGETRSQIITAIGKDNILKQSGDILEVAAAPKPDPNFETFLLILSPKQGLVKLIATGKDIDADPAGRLMKTQFATMKTDLMKGYGEPSDNFDFLDVKATHRGVNQFMLSLTNSERSLATYWTKRDFGNQITSVSLEGNGLGNEKGYLSLEYEFSGYHNYLLAKK